MSATADRLEHDEAPRPRRVARAVAIAVLVLMPLLPFVGSAWVLLAAGLPDYAQDGDGALIELRVRNAAEWRQVLGTYSRLGFDHPGPLHFYACVPLYEATGGRAASLNLTTAILQSLSLLAALLLSARAGGLAAVAAGSLVCSAYVGALGQVLITAWDPTMMILPTLACFVASAAYAAGRAWALPAAALTGALAVQTHLSLVPPIGTSFLVAGIVRATTRRASGTHGGRSRAALVVAVAVGLLVLLPPIAEQLFGRTGNLARIAKTLAGAGQHPEWSTAFALAGARLTSVPATLLGLEEGGAAATIVLFLQVALCAAAVRIATRTGQRFTAALGWIALAVHAVAVVAIRRIVGEVSPHMLLWQATGGVLAWWTIAAVALSRLGQSGTTARWAAGALVAIGVGAGASDASARLLAESLVFVAEPQTAVGTPLLGPTADRVADLLSTHGVRGAELRVLPPPEPSATAQFVAAAGMVLALRKRGFPTAPDPGHAFAYPRGLPTPGPPIAIVALFDASSRPRLAEEGPFDEVVDLGSWGVAIRLP